LQQVQRIEDPAERFRQAVALIEQGRELMKEAREIRRQAVEEMRENRQMSYRAIATELGLTVTRVHDIHRGTQANPKKAKARAAKLKTESADEST